METPNFGATWKPQILGAGWKPQILGAGWKPQILGAGARHGNPKFWRRGAAWKPQILGAGWKPQIWAPGRGMETPYFPGFDAFSVAAWKPQISRPQAIKDCRLEEEAKAREREGCADLFVTRAKL
jgi:hypothetical protein